MKYDGLTTTRAKALLEEHGYNELADMHSFSPLQVLLGQVKRNFMVYLLVAAAIISFFVAKVETAIALIVVILIVILTGFIQEYRAERAMKSLKGMITPMTTVVREGREERIESRLVVPGDTIIVRSGERVPADAVVLDLQDLLVSEAILTGESEPVEKNTAKNADKASDDESVYMGTFVVQGRCTAKVVATGMKTKFGKIAGMISTAQKELPLQTKVNALAKMLAAFAIIAALFTGTILALQNMPITFDVFSWILIIVIALMVASIPEGMPMVLITTLAVGTHRMAKRNAIVNRMSVIEALGEATVICTDKTGTLTRAEMTARSIWIPEATIEVEGIGYERTGRLVKDGDFFDVEKNEAARLLCVGSVLCNDARIEYITDQNEFKTVGTPTEIALLIMGVKAGIHPSDEYGERWEEIPFNSQRKMMSVVYRKKGKETMYLKGAPEFVLEHCTRIRVGNKVRKITKKDVDRIHEVLESYAGDALRTLAFAYKPADPVRKDDEENLVFLGIVALEDPPRDEVPEALATCAKAGIEVKMLTGDNLRTAEAIARKIGLEGSVTDGKTLDTLDDAGFDAAVKETTVFARVRPDHKIRIVRSLKEHGHIIAMTGDGVNDAPAIKEAHIGIAMGKNGTDVTREVADLTLKDDNFSTIVEAVAEGRTIFGNIQKFITYLVSMNFAQLFIIVVSVILLSLGFWSGNGLSLEHMLPLVALQILFMNVISNELMAITLGLHKRSDQVMEIGPRRSAGLLTRVHLTLLLITGSVMTLGGLAIFWLVYFFLDQPIEVARTTLLITLVMFGVANALNYRSFRHLVMRSSPFSNPYIVIAALAAIALTALIIYTPLSIAFETTAVGWEPWLIGIVSGFALVFLIDLVKVLNTRLAILWRHDHPVGSEHGPVH
ncbi:MAG: cation-translocating P-type ATPase [Candidatus Woesearchaeota archaeon]